MIKYFLLFLISTIVINPVFATVEVYNIDLDCPVNSFDFTGTYVEFDMIEMCDVYGNVLNMDPVPVDNSQVYVVESGSVIPEIITQSNTILVGDASIPIKSLKEQIDNFIKEKQDQLKAKFGDKWKERWDNAKGKLKDQFDSILKELLKTR